METTKHFGEHLRELKGAAGSSADNLLKDKNKTSKVK